MNALLWKFSFTEGGGRGDQILNSEGPTKFFFNLIFTCPIKSTGHSERNTGIAIDCKKAGPPERNTDIQKNYKKDGRRKQRKRSHDSHAVVHDRL